MELMDGSLKDLIKLKGKFSEKEAVQCIFKCACSYKYLLQKRTLHRDIKPANILFNETENGEYHFKFGDFGIAKSALMSTFSYKGTPMYMAPEQKKLLHEKGTLTSKADVYPLGLIFFELLTGMNPNYEGFDKKEIKEKLTEHGVSDEVKGFIVKCIE